MKSQKPIASSGIHATRRYFLKSAGMTAAAVAGGLGARAAFSANEPGSDFSASPCKFSELPPDFIYLNSGTEGSMPGCVLSSFRDNLAKWAANPTTSYELDEVLGKHQELNRSRVAKFLGVGKNNICLTDNTTMGCSMTLMGLNFRPRDKVVTTNHEHNAIRSPLQILEDRQGLQLETRPFPPAEKLSGMGARQLVDSLFPNSPSLKGATALCVSHVYPTTGVRLPLHLLRQKAEELEIRYLVVDGAQAMGMIDLGSTGEGLENCDFYACPDHKWLNGPPGTGVLYIRNESIRPPEFYPTISQRMGKYLGSASDPLPAFPMAEALQVRGCSNTPGFAAMVRAMNYVREAGGMDQVEKQILELSGKVKEIVLSRAPHSLLSPYTDPGLLSGLTAFFPFSWNNPQITYTDKDTAERVVSDLLQRNIQVRSIAVPNVRVPDQPAEDLFTLRVSTGYFNTADQVQTFRDALKEVLIQL